MPSPVPVISYPPELPVSAARDEIARAIEGHQVVIVAGATATAIPRRIAGQRVVLVFLAVAALLSIFWYPLWSAMQVPYEFYRLHNWMQGWV